MTEISMDTKKACEFGRNAFLNSARSVPVLDKEFMRLFRFETSGKPVGSGEPFLRAWLQGWHTENINNS
jgi:hypothetical protein